jgi:transposase InsO family protein
MTLTGINQLWVADICGGVGKARHGCEHEPSHKPVRQCQLSFMKTLKREEIYANRYDNLEQLRTNIEEFIEEYYNRQRLHSALGYATRDRGGESAGARDRRNRFLERPRKPFAAAIP